MNWMLLAPLYLLGGLAVAIPLIVHLKNRQQSLPYLFPTLRFIAPSQSRLHRWRNLVQLLVFSLRVLALLALVLAFARPWQKKSAFAVEEAGILVLDVSGSMNAGQAWDRAGDKIKAWIKSREAGTRASVISMGRTGRQIVPFGGNIKDLETALAKVEPTYEGTAVDQALREADDLLQKENVRRKTITVISDMTATAWDKVKWDQPLSPGVRLLIDDVSEHKPENAAVVNVTAPRNFLKMEDPFPVTATIRNFAEVPKTLWITCRVNDKDWGKVINATLPAGGARDVAFAIKPAGFMPVKGEIRIEPEDILPQDNKRFFCVNPRNPVRVGRLKSDPQESDIFLKTALMPYGETASNRFAWIELAPDNPGDLKKQVDVVIMDEGINLSQNSASLLTTFVRNGGAIVLILGEADQPTAWEQEMGLTLDRKRSTGSLATGQHFHAIEFRHPALQQFSMPRGGDLFRVNMYAWRAFKLAGAQPLIRMVNGDPLLAIRNIGTGKLVVFAFPFERSWSDWPLQATFLPMLDRLVNWLAEQGLGNQNFLAGDPLPDGQRAGKPGFVQDPVISNQAWVVNLDPAESDLIRKFNPRLASRLENPVRVITTTGQAPVFSGEEKNTLSWWLLLAVVAFSLAELCLANRTPG